MNRRGVFLSIQFGLLLFLQAVPVSSVPSAGSTLPATLTSQLNIMSNEDLATYAISGAGTASDPYIIGNFNISLPGSSGHIDLINIMDTNAFFVLRNVDVMGTVDGGISVVNLTNGAIESCRFFGADISTYFVDNLRIENNQMTGSGIELGSGYVVGSPIHGTSNITIAGNHIEGAPFGGIYVYNTRELAIYGNTVRNSTHEAMSISNSQDVLVSDNDLRGGETGLWVYDSQGVTVTANQVRDFNSSCLEVTSSIDESEVLVHHNNFINDTFSDLMLGSGSGLKLSLQYPHGGNYWSNASGADHYHGPSQNLSGADGILDSPFNVTSSVQDPYPLAAEFARATVPSFPVAGAVVVPRFGNPYTTFILDAWRSWDLKDPTLDLRFRWDFGADGTWDTPWTTDMRQYHHYAGTGNETVLLETMNQEGLVNSTSMVLLIDRSPPVFRTDFVSGLVLTKEHEMISLNFTCTEQFSGLAYLKSGPYQDSRTDRVRITVNGKEIRDPTCPVSLMASSGLRTGFGENTSLLLMAKHDGRFVVRLSATDKAGNEGSLTVVFEVHSNPLSPQGPYGPWPLAALIAGIAASAFVIILLVLRRRGPNRTATAPPKDSGPLTEGDEPGKDAGL